MTTALLGRDVCQWNDSGLKKQLEMTRGNKNKRNEKGPETDAILGTQKSFLLSFGWGLMGGCYEWPFSVIQYTMLFYSMNNFYH